MTEGSIFQTVMPLALSVASVAVAIFAFVREKYLGEYKAQVKCYNKTDLYVQLKLLADSFPKIESADSYRQLLEKQLRLLEEYENDILPDLKIKKIKHRRRYERRYLELLEEIYKTNVIVLQEIETRYSDLKVPLQKEESSEAYHNLLESK